MNSIFKFKTTRRIDPNTIVVKLIMFVKNKKGLYVRADGRKMTYAQNLRVCDFLEEEKRSGINPDNYIDPFEQKVYEYKLKRMLNEKGIDIE